MWWTLLPNALLWRDDGSFRADELRERERWEQDRISSESVNILLTDYSQRPCTLTLRAFYSLFIMYASSSFMHYWFSKAWIPKNNNLYWDLKKGSSLGPIGISESCQLARVEWSFFSWRVYTHHQRTREKQREMENKRNKAEKRAI